MPRSCSPLCFTGRLEAVSFLILLGIAMPMKYLAGQPLLVKWTGWAHGVLFIAYALLVAKAWRQHGWPLARPVLLMIAAFLPLGPFLIESRLKAWESEGAKP